MPFSLISHGTPSRWVAPCIAVAVIAFAYFWNLGSPVLWGDEADTVDFSRNVLQKGVPDGFDGRNLLVFDNCASVSTSLLSKKAPWVQFYVGAVSLFVFGSTTMGARALFALIGLLTFFPLYSILRRHSRCPALIAALVLVAPQFVLFQRNARYFPILVFLFVTTIWTYYHRFKHPHMRPVLLFVCMLLLFHTHQLAAFCIASSFCVYAMLKKDKALPVLAGAFACGALSWAVFNALLSDARPGEYSIVHLLFTNPAEWLSLFVTGCRVGILDLDFSNSTPLIGWGVLAVVSAKRNVRAKILRALDNPLCYLLGIAGVLQVVGAAGAIGYESQFKYSVLRYFPNIVGFATIPLLLALEALIAGDSFTEGSRIQPSVGASLTASAVTRKSRRRLIVPWLLVAALSNNVLTVSLWLRPLSDRQSALSWWWPVYAEIIRPPLDPMKRVLDLLAQEDCGTDNAISVWPPFLNEVLIHYVGWKYFVVPDIREDSECAKVVAGKIGHARVQKFSSPPKWAVLVFAEARDVPAGYSLVKIPFNRASADATRPELTRHGFAVPAGDTVGFINVYKRID